ncbi:gamma-tubulin complex component 2 [Trichonephila clavipes]|uniref:Gamma-tubulin complex component n=1 Tax=Trichonephila clavipes TaxID=2585209 RepID=A0A8X6VA92_TRICX|nr:gamma-tubulin complex component 2 [Trichonephila clavipes]
MITNFFIPELNNHDVQELWFQQDGATCHTARATINLLKDTFGDRLISRFGLVNWPPRSCDLTPLDYFLWGYVKSLVYADKPQMLDHLEDNNRRVIADIWPQMLEKGNCFGGTVLSVLHENTASLTGSNKAREICHTLTRAATLPYFEILEKWIYKGIISDYYSEFVVEDNELIKKEDLPTEYSDAYWERRYTIRRDQIPIFLSKAADMILRTGKYLNVIRQCGKPVNCPDAKAIVYTMRESQYVEYIEPAYHFASKKLLEVLMDDADLKRRLLSVKHYFLLDQGDFIVQFMDMAEEELQKDIDDIMPTRLESLLELALRTSVVNEDKYKDDVR